MTSEIPEEELGEQEVHQQRPDPEEYEADERDAAVSEETGTVYDPAGEPEITPHDAEAAQDEDDE